MGWILYLVIAVIVFLIIMLFMGIRIVKQATVKVVERLGKYHKTMESGVNIIVPFLDSIRKIRTRMTRRDFQGRNVLVSVDLDYIDLRERVYDFPGQGVITKDNVTLTIDALLYYQVTDPFKAVYEIEDLPMAIEKLTQTTLRNVIGELELDQTLTSRDTINSKLRLILDEATDKWGVKVTRVELKDITPPKEIRVAMEKQMRAERERRETILIAEGDKQAKILTAEGERDRLIAEAEGDKQKRILEATGQADAKIRVAQAEAESIELIKKALGADKIDPAQYLIALKYVETLKDIGGQQGEKVIFMPFESSALLSSVASIKELFNSTKS
jgi:regulator of protease activity HflC (stomatin/prohibitin superfamily)